MDETGELQKYWKHFEETDERAREEGKKIERERKKLELGSDYESDPEEYDGEDSQDGGSQMLAVSLSVINRAKKISQEV